MAVPGSTESHEITLEIKNLVRYYGDLLAVDDLSLQVRKGGKCLVSWDPTGQEKPLPSG